MNIKITIAPDSLQHPDVLNVYLDELAARHVTGWGIREALERYFRRFQGVNLKWEPRPSEPCLLPTVDPHAGNPCPGIDPGEGSCTAQHLTQDGDPV